jgi:thiosulfate/3-mercaptopyruvate sulfurtransferase
MKMLTAIFVSIFIIVDFIPSSLGAALSLPGPLVSSQWVADHLEHVVVLDVRKLKADSGKSAKEEGFIPGAVLLAFQQVTQSMTQNAHHLKSMTLERFAFAKLMAQSGVKNHDIVIITGPGKRLNDLVYVTRLYWSLKYYGHDAVAILDGGNALWQAGGRSISAQGRTPTATRYKIKKTRHDILASSRPGSVTC